ncbi:hypothetical protein EON81_02150 [bacterium]|nr:MAG: hypothetical protein EON81_02150 [bacterium]
MRQLLLVLVFPVMGSCRLGPAPSPPPADPPKAGEILVRCPASNQTDPFTAVIPKRFRAERMTPTEKGFTAEIPFFKGSKNEELMISVSQNARPDFVESFDEIRAKGLAKGDPVVRSLRMTGTLDTTVYGKRFNRKIVRPLEVSTALTDGKGVITVRYEGDGDRKQIEKEVRRVVESLRY